MFDVTLSFDNGPHPETTQDVLAVLRDHDVKTTFFTIGRRLAEAGGIELAERAWRDGHWIGNHTWNHTVPLGERGEAGLAESELASTQVLVKPFSHAHKWFPPFGGGGNLDRRLLNRAVVEYLAANRFSCVLWNAVPRDWIDPEGWVETALTQCNSQPWTLMVLHDLPTGAMRHLPRFIDEVRKRGGRFRQEFPPDCVPMLDGRVTGSLEQFTRTDP